MSAESTHGSDFSSYLNFLREQQEHPEVVHIAAPLPPEHVGFDVIFNSTMQNIGVDIDSDQARLLKAVFDDARQAYARGKHPIRFSNEEYFVHPAIVAYLVSLTHSDPNKIIAAWFHDAPEDVADIKIEILESLYGPQVSEPVDFVTKVSLDAKSTGLEGESVKEMERRETEEKLLEAVIVNMFAFELKLYDALNNMETIGNDPKTDRVNDKARRALRFARIAYTVGAINQANRIGDIALSILHPNRVKIIHDMRNTHVDGKMLRKLQNQMEMWLDKKSDGLSYLSYTVDIPSDYEILEIDPKIEAIKEEDVLPKLKIVAGSETEALQWYAKLGRKHGFNGGEKEINPVMQLQEGNAISKNIYMKHNGKVRQFEVMISTPEIEIKPIHLFSEGNKDISESERVSAESKMAVLRKTYEELKRAQRAGLGHLILDTQEILTRGIIVTKDHHGHEILMPSGATALDQLLYDPESASKATGVIITRGNETFECSIDTPLENGDVVTPIIDEDAIPHPTMYDKVTTNHSIRTLKTLLESCEKSEKACEVSRKRGIDIIHWLFYKSRGKQLDVHLIDAFTLELTEKFGDLNTFLKKLGQQSIPAFNDDRHELWIQAGAGENIVSDAFAMVHRLENFRNQTITINLGVPDQRGVMENIGRILKKHGISANPVRSRPDKYAPNLGDRPVTLEIVLEPGTSQVTVDNIVKKINKKYPGIVISLSDDLKSVDEENE